MKNFFLLFCSIFIVTVAAHAQSFEGTIEWDVETEVKDPKLKQEMEKGMKDLQSPETQKAIETLESQLNDPEYQKQLSQNPEMKAMLEQQLQQMKSMQKMGQDGGSFMPTHITVHIKDDKSVTNVDGGMGEMFGEILYLGDKNVSYSVDDENKTYSRMPEEKKDTSMQAEVKKMGSGSKIMGYPTEKYKIVEKDEKGSEITSYVWVTDDIEGLDPEVLSRANNNDYMSSFLQEVNGVPLKVETQSKEMDITMEVVDIQRKDLNTANFEIPSDYQETQGVWSRR